MLGFHLKGQRRSFFAPQQHPFALKAKVVYTEFIRDVRQKGKEAVLEEQRMKTELRNEVARLREETKATEAMYKVRRGMGLPVATTKRRPKFQAEPTILLPPENCHLVHPPSLEPTPRI